ncbi:putative transcriptional regulator [Caldalkalibacillus uzonensis]|uniref:Transcriptional regulator n=1 Tax=Caldalkalibacillus uzonensis TaxID=353224 RepID=A0ABU0CQE7_9BACI|nr:ArsR family transcriptional regulator [Caldalkalibacillus uzonensis]MDQ0338632.1 putative transcriptional regulator [Caldalkalibacillus uzonensis]
MKVDISEQSLPVFEALASQIRLKVIHLLAEQPMNIRELAQAVGLSNAIMTMHVKKLEKAGIIESKMIPGKAGLQKLCFLNVDKIEIIFPSKQENKREFHQVDVSVGHFTDFNIKPTCGLATPEKIIGEFDDPRYFLDPERVNAKILWFGQGYIEYKVPNFLLASQEPEELEISLELSSEAPFTNNNWPSDIAFYLNGVHLGTWTSPGDFGDKRGKYTPEWWPSVVNQYGLLKHLRITEKGTYMDGIKLSEVTLLDIGIRETQWTFRIAVHEDAQHVGGVTIYGTGFGNYNQDIIFRLYYSPVPQPVENGTTNS